jgi:hypothetical protein
MRQCAQMREWMSVRLDGRLESDRIARLERHLVDCARCRDFLRELERLVAEVQGLPPVTPPSDLVAKVRSRIDNRVAWPLRPWFSMPQVGAALAASLLLAAAAYSLRDVVPFRSKIQVTPDLAPRSQGNADAMAKRLAPAGHGDAAVREAMPFEDAAAAPAPRRPAPQAPAPATEVNAPDVPAPPIENPLPVSAPVPVSIAPEPPAAPEPAKFRPLQRLQRPYDQAGRADAARQPAADTASLPEGRAAYADKELQAARAALRKASDLRPVGRVADLDDGSKEAAKGEEASAGFRRWAAAGGSTDKGDSAAVSVPGPAAARSKAIAESPQTKHDAAEPSAAVAARGAVKTPDGGKPFATRAEMEGRIWVPSAVQTEAKQGHAEAPSARERRDEAAGGESRARNAIDPYSKGKSASPGWSASADGNGANIAERDSPAAAPARVVAGGLGAGRRLAPADGGVATTVRTGGSVEKLELAAERTSGAVPDEMRATLKAAEAADATFHVTVRTRELAKVLDMLPRTGKGPTATTAPGPNGAADRAGDGLASKTHTVELELTPASYDELLGRLRALATVTVSSTREGHTPAAQEGSYTGRWVRRATVGVGLPAELDSKAPSLSAEGEKRIRLVVTVSAE